jgi:protein-disulfide isomerase
MRMVYNCRDDTDPGGGTLIGTAPDAHTRNLGILALLVLAALMVALSACAAGSGGSSQSSEKQENAGSSGQKTEGAGTSGRVSEKRLEHPALGSAEAPVVLTEYSDYQ